MAFCISSGRKEINGRQRASFASLTTRDPIHGIGHELLDVGVAPAIGRVISSVGDVHDASNRGVAQNHSVDSRRAPRDAFHARTKLGNAHVGGRGEGERGRKARPNRMHRKCWIHGVINLAAISADAREQHERRQGLPAASVDLIRRPFRQDEAIAGRIDEIEQRRLSRNWHVGLERRISRTTRQNNDCAKTSERWVCPIVLVRRNRRDGRRKTSRCQGCCECRGSRRTVVGDDQNIFRAHTRGIRTHTRSADDTASAAIVGIVQGIEFATIGGIAVAIGETRIATGQGAHSADTSAHAIGRVGTHHAAHTAIHLIGIKSRFAAIGDHHVAIVESRLAGSDRTHPHRAGTRPIGDGGTGHSTTTAMPNVCFCVGFTAVKGPTEAIGKPGDATADAAGITSTSGKPVGNGGTNVSASSAMCDRIGQIGFAPIGDHAIAIVITSIAATNDARRRFAFRISMRNGAANFGAHTAMENIGGELRFATAPNAVVAIIETRGTRSDGAYAIGTTRRRIGRGGTHRPARAAIQRIRARIDFAAVGL